MTTLQTALAELEPQFNKKNDYGLTFESECHFALQQITKSDSVLATARNNQASLRNAIMNVSAIGISLNPAFQHAYLVPRNGSICLDVSYRGMVKLATDSGAIDWAKSVLVYEGDIFEWKGPAEPPLHEADVFKPDRMNAQDPLENLRGGYCLAKLHDGGYMVDTMTAAEIIEIKNSSKAKSGPWSGKWSGEMAKKTLVKRASKSWPQSSGRDRLDNAIEIINEHEGVEFTSPVSTGDYLRPTAEQTEKYLELAKGDSVDFWLWYRKLDQRIQSSLPGCEFERGQKGKMMKFFNGQIEDGRMRLDEWSRHTLEMLSAQDEHAVKELFEEMDAAHIEAIIDELPIEMISEAKKIKGEVNNENQ